jgi:LEA14-like dessication related protein
MEANGNYIAFRVATGHGFTSGDSVVFRNVDGFNGQYTATYVGGEWLYLYRNANPTMPDSAPTLTAESQVLKGLVPFVVSDGKVYIESAAIADASITTAKISELSATKITAGYVNAAVQMNGARIFAGSFYSGGTVTINQDGSFFANNPTARIANGIAEFDATTFRILNGNVYTTPFEVVGGVVYIDDARIREGTITSAKISSVIYSTNFESGLEGWAIYKETGSAEFQNVTLRGVLKSSDGNFEIDTIGKRIRIIS